jgi:predicted RNase H-like HicB family nuclease
MIKSGNKAEDKMIREYIDTALKCAHYEMIDNDEPYYGEVKELPGVWATGKTLEDCRQRLAETIDGWILIRLSHNLSIPEISGAAIIPPKEINVA